MNPAQALGLHRLFLRAGLTMNVFAWIFIFQYFYVRSGSLRYALAGSALSFALVHDVTLLLTPFSAQRLRHGSNKLITKAVIFAALAYGSLGLAFSGAFGSRIGYGVLLFALCLGAYRACYWVPYETDVARQGPISDRWRTLYDMLFAFLPALAGIILMSGYPAPLIVLFGAALCILASLIPLTAVPQVHEGFAWKYRDTFGELLDPRHSTLVFSSIADGISGAALLLFWPIAIFLIVGWSYGVLGIILTVTFFIVLFLRGAVRALLTKLRVHESALLQAVLTASSWVFRLMVSSPLGIVLVDSYYYTGSTTRRSGIDRLVFEQSADGGSYVDEYTALKEIALALGRIAACFTAVILLTLFTLPITFIAVFLLASAASAYSVYVTWQSKTLAL